MHLSHQGGKFFNDVQFDHQPMNLHEMQVSYYGFFRESHRRVVQRQIELCEIGETGRRICMKRFGAIFSPI